MWKYVIGQSEEIGGGLRSDAMQLLVQSDNFTLVYFAKILENWPILRN